MHDVENVLPEIVVTGNVSLEPIRVFIELKTIKKGMTYRVSVNTAYEAYVAHVEVDGLLEVS